MDDATERMWPNAEQRAARKEILLGRLSTFLDEFVESEGGWALATAEHVAELDEIIDEIIDLKFQRDPDGDRTIRQVLVNRRNGHLLSVFVPYDPGRRDNPDPTDDEILAHISELNRVEGYLVSSASSISDQIRNALWRLTEQRQAEAKMRERIAWIENALGPETSFNEARAYIENMPRSWPKDERDRLSDKFVEAYKDVISPEIAALMPLVERTLEDDCPADYRTVVREKIEDLQNRLGYVAATAVRLKFNEGVQERRRKARAASQKPTEDYAGQG